MDNPFAPAFRHPAGFGWGDQGAGVYVYVDGGYILD